MKSFEGRRIAAIEHELARHEAARRADERARRGQGAFYTPDWLVEVVVRETFRHVRHPGQASVCDPTCGAGSFLAGAAAYTERLHGVDVDPEAIALARVRLPGAALVVGEALVGLDWEAAFPGTGGAFDVLVGNPPFVRIQHLREHEPGLADALTGRYASASGNFDLYGPFLELALERMRQAAGFVLPQRFFKTESGRYLRERLAPHVAYIADFGDRQVFPGTGTYVCAVVLVRQPRTSFLYMRAWDADSPGNSGVPDGSESNGAGKAWGPGESERLPVGEPPGLPGKCEPQAAAMAAGKGERAEFASASIRSGQGSAPDPIGARASAVVPTRLLAPEAWVPLLDDEQRAWEKLREGGVPLLGTDRSPAIRLFVGLQTPSNRIFRLRLVGDLDGLHLLVESEVEDNPFPIERAVTGPLLMGADVRAYRIRDRDRLVLIPYRDGKLVDLPAEAPLATAYLGRHLGPGGRGGKRERWWAYPYPKNLGAFEQPKLLVGGVAARGRYAYDEKGRYYVVGGGDGGYSLLPRPGVDPWALLALLASTPLDFCLQRQSSLFAGRCYSYGRRFLHGLPIRQEALTAELAALARARARETAGARAASLEREIDFLVGRAYELGAADWKAIRRLVPERKPF